MPILFSFLSLSLLSYLTAQILSFSLAFLSFPLSLSRFLSLAEDGVVCTFAFGVNGKYFESVNDNAMEAKNHGGAAYGD